MANAKMTVACLWCGDLFETTSNARYCSDACRQMASLYLFDLHEAGEKITMDKALWKHKNEVVPTVQDRVLAPVKITSSATQWKFIEREKVDGKVLIIKGGRNGRS